MNNCELQCPDQLELLAQLAAKVEYLYQFYRNLSLSDLTDVKDCLAPTRDQHLVYDGTIWDAADQMKAELTIEPLLDSGVQIANITFNGETTTLYCKDGTVVTVTPASISGPTMDIATITVDGVTKTIKSKDFTGVINEIWEIINNLHPTEVNVQADYTTGTKVATITVNNQSTDIKIPTATNVQVDAEEIPGGTTIATITVDGTPTQIKAPSGGGEGNLDNIEVNNIEGTVEDKVAKVTVYGSDIITGTEYAESEEVNEDLEIETTDTIDESLGKLQKALKDDEVVVAKAFHAVKEATGFDTNLHYVVEVDDPILGQAEDLQSADRFLKDHLSNLKTHVSNIIDEQGIQFTGGITGSFTMKDVDSYNKGFIHNITVPLFTVINVTVNYPIKDYLGDQYDYYTDALVRDLVYQPKSIVQIKGGLYTWEVSSGVWELWQYVGTDTLEVNWVNSNNWIKRW